MDTVGPRQCSVARTLEIIGEKWSVLALREVFAGVRRFDRIQANTGAPRDVLTRRLRTLLTHGVLERRQYSQRPPRYEYRLTSAGKELLPVLLTLQQWGDRHLYTDEPPITYEHTCGETFEALLVCASCRQPVLPRDLRILHEHPEHVGL